jgi:hypothetical protein
MSDTTHELRFLTNRRGRVAFCSADSCDWVMLAPGTGTARFQVEHNRHHHQENPS